MLAPRVLPDAYLRFNRRVHAPYGRRGTQRLTRLHRPSWLAARLSGAYAFQPNNTSRVYEYPWAHEQVRRRGSGLRIVDVGGGLAGLQWTLAADGDEVINIDPGLEAQGVGFQLDHRTHGRLSRLLNAPVQHVSAPIQDADLPDDSIDVILSVSTLEHLSEGDLRAFAATVRRVLSADGALIATLDLFLDLAPFTRRERNIFGNNVDVRDLLEAAGLVLAEGRRNELYGFPEFDADRVQSELARYLIGQDYPTLTQLVVAVRPSVNA